MKGSARNDHRTFDGNDEQNSVCSHGEQSWVRLKLPCLPCEYSRARLPQSRRTNVLNCSTRQPSSGDLKGSDRSRKGSEKVKERQRRQCKVRKAKERQ